MLLGGETRLVQLLTSPAQLLCNVSSLIQSEGKYMLITSTYSRHPVSQHFWNSWTFIYRFLSSVKPLYIFYFFRLLTYSNLFWHIGETRTNFWEKTHESSGSKAGLTVACFFCADYCSEHFFRRGENGSRASPVEPTTAPAYCPSTNGWPSNWLLLYVHIFSDFVSTTLSYSNSEQSRRPNTLGDDTIDVFAVYMYPLIVKPSINIE